MAIVKHVSSKNSNYGNSIEYLTQQYDEKLNKPILDEYENLQERDEYLISYMKPDGSKAAVEEWEGDCTATNVKYGQNAKEGDLKTHHYIVSFEDQDNISLEDAQKYGEDLAAEMFPGHSRLVAAHPGHVHIVINSVREEEDKRREEWMKHKKKNSDELYIPPCEYKAGGKHNCSRAFLKHIKTRVMEMCQERDLNQSVDLNKPARVKKTDKEYYAEKQAAENKKITQKEFVRRAIDQAKSVARTAEEYTATLKTLGVDMEARGKNMRYKTTNGKWIRENKLGADYTLPEIAKQLELNQKNLQKETVVEKTPSLDDIIKSGKTRIELTPPDKRQHRETGRTR